MRKIIAATFVSANGYFAGPNGEQDWTFAYITPELQQWIANENKGHDAIIMGETTYTMHKDYWPNVPVDQDASAKFMNETPKIIISKDLTDAPWGTFGNTTVVSTDVFNKIRQMKDQPGKNMVIVGSGSIVQQFTNGGLIDEYDLITLPVILAQGRELFQNLTHDQALALREVKQLKNGVAIHRYEPAAAPKARFVPTAAE